MESPPLYAMGLVFVTAVEQVYAQVPGSRVHRTTIPPECTQGELNLSMIECNPQGHPNLFMKFGNLGSIPKNAFTTYSNLIASSDAGICY